MGCDCGKRADRARERAKRSVPHLGTLDPDSYRAKVIAQFAASKKRATR